MKYCHCSDPAAGIHLNTNAVHVQRYFDIDIQICVSRPGKWQIYVFRSTNKTQAWPRIWLSYHYGCLHHPLRLLFYPLLTMSRTTLFELMIELTRIDELTTTFSCVGAKFSSSGRSMMSSESEWRPPAGAVAWEAYGKILFIKIITT